MILVTGGTGLVGSAVLDALEGESVISLTRHGASGWSADGAREGRSAGALLSTGNGHVVGAYAASHVEHLHGDVTRPRLGLSESEHEQLAERVDVVIHAAGVTDYTTPRATTESFNVTGTRNVARFAEHARAPLYHVSTGYVRAQAVSVRGRFGAQVYLDSKREAERVVGECATLAAIVRPSVVFGHSSDGSSASFQGFHRLVRLVLENDLPLLPFPEETRVDFLPRDVVGRVIAKLATDGFQGEFWLTAGADAPAFSHVVELLVGFAADHGRRLDRPRFVSREMIERLLKPVGGPALARRVDLLLALTSHLQADPLPSSLAPEDRMDLDEVLLRGAGFWAQRSGWAERDPVRT